MGGGVNHRMNLSEMVLIKDNHLEIVGSIAEAVQTARAKIPCEVKIEVEVTDLETARQAVEAGADMIMLDNVVLDQMKEIIDWVAGRVPIEVSGGVDLARVRAIAEAGPDYISVGALTHSFRSVDISLDFEPGSAR